MNLHIRVPREVYNELQGEARDKFCEGTSAEFVVVDGKFFVSPMQKHDKIGGSIYVGTASTPNGLRLSVTGKVAHGD